MQSVGVSQRFQRIPSLQQQREVEYGRQAQEAQQLYERLRDTRYEAEKAAKEEIERTRRIQIEEFQRHPEMQQWRRSITDLEQQVKAWSRTAERRSQELRESIAGLERKIFRKQEDLRLVQAQASERANEYGKLRQQVAELEGELSGIRRQFEEARLNESDLSSKVNPAMAEHDRLKKQLEEYKSRRAVIGSEWEGLKSKEADLISQCEILKTEIGRLNEQLKNWDFRLMEINDEYERAKMLQSEAQDFVSQHSNVLSKLRTDKDQYMQQMGQIKSQRDSINTLTGQLSSKFRDKEANVHAFEERANQLDQRWVQVDAELKKLQEESIRLQNEYHQVQGDLQKEREELDQIVPHLRDAESQSVRVEQMYRETEQRLEQCISRMTSEEIAARQLDEKATEANDEVKKAFDLRNQATKGKELTSQQLSTRNQQFETIRSELASLQNKIGPKDLSVLDRQLEEKQQECDHANRHYLNIIEELRQAKKDRERIEHQLGGLESQIRQKKAQLEEEVFRGPSEHQEKIRAELDALQAELEAANHHLEETSGTNPFVSQLQALQEQSYQIESKVYSAWTAQNAPKPLLDQLKREAEAVMRAEAALALERQQGQVFQDASTMTRYHISSRPRFDIDEQGKNVLLREHATGTDPKDIASTVLEMCQQHHIYA